MSQGQAYTSNFAAKYIQNSTTDGRYNDSKYNCTTDRHEFSFTEYNRSLKKDVTEPTTTSSLPARDPPSTAYDYILQRKERKPFKDTRDKDLH